jgi:hypothetical protein
MWITINLPTTLRNLAVARNSHDRSQSLYLAAMKTSDLQNDAHGKSLECRADSKRNAIAPSSDLGRNAFVFDEGEVVHLLRAAVDREGSQIAFADHYGVDRANVSSVLNGRRRINDSLVKALGLRKVYVVE